MEHQQVIQNNNLLLTDDTIKLFLQGNIQHAIIDAVAGSGKSTWLINILKMLPAKSKVLVLAFNTENVKTFKKYLQDINLPFTPRVSSIHGLSYSIFCGKTGNDDEVIEGNPLIKENLYHKDADNVFGKEQAGRYAKITAIGNLVSKMQNIIVDFQNVTTDKAKVIRETFSIGDNLADEAVRNNVDNVSVILLKRRVENYRIGGHKISINYDDMMWLPIVLNIPIPDSLVFDWILVDELQDLSDIQIEFINRLLIKSNNHTRIIAAGDARQAIYSFRGAKETMAKMKAILAPVEFTLPVCRRCPTKVLDLARVFVPHIQNYKQDAGVVKFLPYEDAFGSLQKGDVVMCRNAKKMIEVAYSLVKIEKPAMIIGEKKLKTQIKEFFETNNQVEFKQLKIIAKNAFKNQKDRLFDQYSPGQIKYYEDLYQCIEYLIDTFATYNLLKEFISRVFKRRKDIKINDDIIRCSTIHRSKGETIKRVFILTSKYDPSFTLGSLIEEERNLWYVAITRSASELYLVECKDVKDDRPSAVNIPKELKTAIDLVVDNNNNMDVNMN